MTLNLEHVCRAAAAGPRDSATQQVGYSFYMPTFPWHKFHELRWYAVLAMTVATFSAAAMYNPLVPVAIFIIVSGILVVAFSHQNLRVGIGVLGAIAAVILIPTLNTPLPPFAGMLCGGLWAAAVASTAGRTPRASITYNMFVVVLALGLGGSILAPSFPWLAIVVSAFTIFMGYIAKSMNHAEWILVQRGLIILGIVEALLCGYETLVLGSRISGSLTGGAHPILAGAVRAEGTLGHPLVAGMVMLAALAITLASSISLRWKSVSTVLLLAGIFACGSSSVYIAAALTLFLGYIGSGSIPAKVIKSVVAGGCCLYLLLAPSILDPITTDVSGVNSTHRINSIIAFPRLFTERPLVQSLLGSGWGTAKENYQAGYLINDNFFSVDNQFTTVMMACGLLGLLLFVAAVAVTLRQTHPTSRPALFTLTFMFFSFDVLSWGATAVLFIVLAVHTHSSSPKEVQPLHRAVIRVPTVPSKKTPALRQQTK